MVQRFHALDAVRGFALLLGVVLHATMSFFLPIPAQDSSRSAALALLFFVIHTFRMSLFFMVAGFFARMAFHRIGPRAFVKDRARRIVAPMMVGWLLLAPPTLALVILGFTKSFPDGLPAGMDAATNSQEGFPLIHLWFLYYLCLLYGLALSIRAGFVAFVDPHGQVRARIDTVVRALLSNPLAPIVLGAPLCIALTSDPAWPLWFGIPAPDQGLLPQFKAIIGFGTAFGLGWLVQRQTSLLDLWRARWAGNLAVAACLSIVCLALAGRTPPPNSLAFDGPPWARTVFALTYTASIWYWTFGLIGAAQRFGNSPSPLRRYLADSSYWVYLVHLPIVFGLQVLVMDWPLHWALKFPLIIATTLVLTLASYHYIVRSTFIGEILNGRKRPSGGEDLRPAQAPATTAGEPSGREHPVPLAQLAGVTKRYGTTTALDELSLVVKPGEVLALLGPNGAGKSTAIGLWLGILEPDAGTATLMGGSPFDVQSRLGIGVMMQEVSLAPMLSAREHITLASSYYKNPMSVEATLEVTGITQFADKRYISLSGGQKRQVQFAVSVCGRPRLLFLDEPTVGLDALAREAMWRTIRALVDDGCSIVLTTHYLEEAEALADRVAMIAKGRLLAEGSIEEIRALVTRGRIRCASALEVEHVKRWPGVIEAERKSPLLHLTTTDTEAVVRLLLDADPGLSRLEVQQASLAEALAEITREAA
jgi:ABC-type multidrug transport system ATPase subunit/peptidoglycan/LPS O-acetylase OafA/YrhL